MQRTLAAGKLTEPVLHMFLATGNEEVLHIVLLRGIRTILKPVLPTSMVFANLFLFLLSS
jgi:hypothetical protein